MRSWRGWHRSWSTAPWTRPTLMWAGRGVQNTTHQVCEWLILAAKNSQRIVPGLWVTEIGYQKGLSCPEAGKYNMLIVECGFSCRLPYNQNHLKDWLVDILSTLSWRVDRTTPLYVLPWVVQKFLFMDAIIVDFLSWIFFVQENGQLKLNVQYVSMSAISQVRTHLQWKTKSVNNNQRITSLFHSALAFHHLTKLGFIRYVCPLGGHKGSTSKSVPQFKTHQV